MIAVIDNGCSYSDHSIWFVDIGDEDPRLVEKVAKAGRSYGNPFIVFTAPSVEWYQGETMPMAALVGGFWCDDVEDLRYVETDTVRALIRIGGEATNVKLLNEVLAARGAA